MVSSIDHERLIMTGVLIVALVLWAGIVAESTGLYPDGKTTAATVLGVIVPLFSALVLVVYHLTGLFSDEM